MHTKDSNESIRDWPDQAALAARIRGAGWDSVEYRDLTFGIVALHRARKAESAGDRAEGGTGTLEE